MRDTQPIFDIPPPFAPLYCKRTKPSRPAKKSLLPGWHRRPACVSLKHDPLHRRDACATLGLRPKAAPCLRGFVAPSLRNHAPSRVGSPPIRESHSRVSFSPLYNMRPLRPFHFPAQNSAFLGRSPPMRGLLQQPHALLPLQAALCPGEASRRTIF